MEYYTSYFISPEAHANTTQEDAVIKVNSFKKHETCSRQALVKKEDLIPVQVYVELSILLNSNIHDILYKNITQNNNLIIIVSPTVNFKVNL